MSFPPYREYKDSEIPWVGEVPSLWDRKPLFALVRELDDRNEGMKEDNLLSLSYGKIKRKNIDDNDGLLPASFETYQIVERDDVVWRLTDLQNDQRSLRTGIVRERGIITSAYLATRPVAIMPEFLAYLLRAYDLTKVFYSMGGGLRQSMKFSDVRWLPVMLPSPAEQTAIAAFLDRETAKIDALVAEQERLIALLKEKRQAVISHAVTKGLNPNALMKDSGIEWLGKIPAHWEVRRLRFVAAIETGDADTANAIDNGEYPFFVRSPNIERINGFTHDCEAVMTAGDGAGVGKVFHHFAGKFRAHQRVYIFRNFRGVTGKWFYEYLKALFYRVVLEGTAKSTVDSLRRPMIADFPMTVPPAAEVPAIERHIAQKSAQFDALIAEAQSAITLLQERRAALISAAVTGKIDVRDLAETSQELELA